MITIDYRNIEFVAKNLNKIYLNYLYDFNKVQNFFNGDFRNSLNFLSIANSISKEKKIREKVSNVIFSQMQKFEISDETKNNIECLKNENTFAIVTGQQSGIFLGPLYTIYKTFTAIQLAKKLSEKFPEKKFVPIFYLECEDHDYEEISLIKILNKEKKVSTHRYFLNSKNEKAQVGSLNFDLSIEYFKEKILDDLIHTEFSDELKKNFLSLYNYENNFADSFTKILLKLFGEYGLVILNPFDKELKKILIPIFEKEILEYPTSSQLLVTQTDKIEKEYVSQIKIRPINLFFTYNDERYALEPFYDDINLKGTRINFSKKEILDFLHTNPEKFSPNVSFRPICQDYILPTVSYVGGPSEIAYFTQIKPLYNYFGLTMPIIFPRVSLTISESDTQKVIEKHKLNHENLFEEKEILKNKILNHVVDSQLDKFFEESKMKLKEILDDIENKVQNVDLTLKNNFETVKNKIYYQVENIKHKTIEMEKKKFSTISNQIEKSANSFFPNDNWQERELNVIYFLNKYGILFFEKLFEEIEIENFNHQIFHISK